MNWFCCFVLITILHSDSNHVLRKSKVAFLFHDFNDLPAHLWYFSIVIWIYKTDLYIQTWPKQCSLSIYDNRKWVLLLYCTSNIANKNYQEGIYIYIYILWADFTQHKTSIGALRIWLFLKTQSLFKMIQKLHWHTNTKPPYSGIMFNRCNQFLSTMLL